MTKFILLASYPKSGNTWVRAVLDSLMRGGAEVDINAELAGTTNAADRRAFDREMGVEASDLTEDEINRARPLLWPLIKASDGRAPMIKIHDSMIPPGPGYSPLFPVEAIAAAIYVARDPRDVAVSFAHHFGTSIDEAITWMADATTTLDRVEDSLPSQLPQFLSSWSRHVESWLDCPGLPLHLTRYEDLSSDPLLAVTAFANFLGLEADGAAVAAAVAATRFDTLRAQENAAGFREREPHMDRFFRRGIAGGWRDSLTPAQAARIEADHGAVMGRLGYLP